MADNKGITSCIKLVGKGDEAATKTIFDAFFARLVALAGRRLATTPRRDFDEEDVAVATLETLVKGLRAGRFQTLDDSDDLWRLLACITKRKVIARLRHRDTERQGGGKVRGESAIPKREEENERGGIDNCEGNEPTPDDVVMFEDTLRHLLEILPSERHRNVIRWKMEGRNNGEIAPLVGCVRRNVERDLKKIREIWALEEFN